MIKDAEKPNEETSPEEIETSVTKNKEPKSQVSDDYENLNDDDKPKSSSGPEEKDITV